MGLRELAERDNRAILENRNEFGYPFTLTSPEGVTAPMTGFTNDIAIQVDPDTGGWVSGRTASIAVNITSLRLAGFPTNPQNIMDQNKKPWAVAFRDINQVPMLFKVIQSNPDRGLGMMTLLLETYKQAVLYNGAWTFNGAQEYDGVINLL